MFNQIKESIKNSAIKSFEEEANSTYSIVDWKGKLYYACNGVPAIEISEDTKASEIQEKLSSIKSNYINYKADGNELQPV